MTIRDMEGNEVKQEVIYFHDVMRQIVDSKESKSVIMEKLNDFTYREMEILYTEDRFDDTVEDLVTVFGSDHNLDSNMERVIFSLFDINDPEFYLNIYKLYVLNCCINNLEDEDGDNDSVTWEGDEETIRA